MLKLASQKPPKRVPPPRLSGLEVSDSQGHRRSGFYFEHRPLRKTRAQQLQLGNGFSVHWTAQKDHCDEDPVTLESDYVWSLKGDLWHATAKRRVGYFRGYVLPVSTLCWDESVFFLECDCRSAELCDLGEAVLTSGSGFFDSLAGWGDLFFARYLEVLLPFRGRRIGLAVFKAFADLARFEFGAGVCCFKPFPLQCVGWAREGPSLAERRRSFLSAKRRLTDYYLTAFPAKRFPHGELPDGEGFYYFKM